MKDVKKSPVLYALESCLHRVLILLLKFYSPAIAFNNLFNIERVFLCRGGACRRLYKISSLVLMAASFA